MMMTMIHKVIAKPIYASFQITFNMCSNILNTIKMRLKSEHCTFLFTHTLCASYLLMLRRSMGKCGMRHGKNYNAVYITRKIAKSHKQYAMEEQLASKALFSPFRWYVFRIYCIKTPFVKNIIKINYFLFMYF